MKMVNQVKFTFMSRSVNESFARAALAAFLAQADPTVPQLADIKTAVSEAVTNCIVHAYPQQVGQIHAGDLMLYRDNCVVLFYEDFSTTYAYTRLGSVEDPAGLADALGSGAVSVSFEVQS